jgi:uncharacterized protein (TIGR00369 family)
MNEHLRFLEEEMRDLQRHSGPDEKFPPDCFLSMKAEFIDYVSRESLTVSFPVLEESLNPMQKMQGGFLTAAFDNAFGPLSYLAARSPCVTLTLNTQFIRPVGLGDRLMVRAKVLSRSMQVIHLAGEAFDSKNRLVALASATVTVVKREQPPSH